MQSMILLTLICSVSASASNAALQTNPIEKVIQMMSDLQQKVIGEGEAAQKVYDEFAEWCEEESKNLGFEIKTAKAEAEDLNAVIDQCVSDIKAGEDKIAELVEKITQAEKDLEDATVIRESENKDFLAEEAELVDTKDALERAIGILEKEMAKTGSASLMQLRNADSIAAALKVLVEARSIRTSDASRLTALIQNQQSNNDKNYMEELGAPAAKAYESKSGGIVEVLNDLLADAEGQLSDLRKKEANLQANYEMLKQELTDTIKFGNAEKAKTEKANQALEETKAENEGNLEVTNKDMAADIAQLAATHQDCMTKAQDFEAETAARGEELAVLAKAKKIIIEATGGAADQTYSFLQLRATMTAHSRLSTRADLANYEAVKYLKKLSVDLHSSALAQLANRMAAAARMSAAAGEDPFAKVKGLIAEMIERLIKEAEEDAAQKAYCDKEMGETKAKKEELTTDIEELTTKIDKMTADSAKLKEEVAVLSKELADLAKSQAEMDKVREEEKAAYDKNKAEMEQGLEGIQLALKVLREYYAKGAFIQTTKQDGAAAGIIGLLEVVESDFSKGLAEMIAIEEAAVKEYEKVTKENEIAKVTKEQDVKYKTKEAKTLSKAAAEKSEDRDGLQTELDAVLDYWKKIQEQCVAKPESYEERKKRREAEIAGLKDALAILEGEAALIQKTARHITLRSHW